MWPWKEVIKVTGKTIIHQLPTKLFQKTHKISFFKSRIHIHPHYWDFLLYANTTELQPNSSSIIYHNHWAATQSDLWPQGVWSSLTNYTTQPITFFRSSLFLVKPDLCFPNHYLHRTLIGCQWFFQLLVRILTSQTWQSAKILPSQCPPCWQQWIDESRQCMVLLLLLTVNE